jgi:hypothetical protein
MYSLSLPLKCSTCDSGAQHVSCARSPPPASECTAHAYEARRSEITSVRRLCCGCGHEFTRHSPNMLTRDESHFSALVLLRWIGLHGRMHLFHTRGVSHLHGATVVALLAAVLHALRDGVVLGGREEHYLDATRPR